MNQLVENKELADIIEKVGRRERLTFEDGVRLFQSNDLATLGRLAHGVRQRLHERRVYYSVNLHLNYTNVCTAGCVFCAFRRQPGEEGAYRLLHDEIETRIEAAAKHHRINEVHIVGGLNPELDLDYFVGMVRMVRRLAPSVFIKAFTAVEIDDLAVRSDLTWKETLLILKRAGLDGLPGGGAEIFNEPTRRKICAHKTTAENWLEIHRIAHGLGLKTNCTMLYGHIETIEDRVDHILRLRALQDETGGFQSFVPFPLNVRNTPLEARGETGGYTDLKVFALSRLLFDNVRHIKAHWSSLNLKLAQVALFFGADDVGGTNLNEKIMHEAGNETPADLSEERLRRMIEREGFEPVRVDSGYGKQRTEGRKQSAVSREQKTDVLICWLPVLTSVLCSLFSVFCGGLA